MPPANQFSRNPANPNSNPTPYTSKSSGSIPKKTLKIVLPLRGSCSSFSYENPTSTDEVLFFIFRKWFPDRVLKYMGANEKVLTDHRDWEVRDRIHKAVGSGKPLFFSSLFFPRQFTDVFTP